MTLLNREVNNMKDGKSKKTNETRAFKTEVKQVLDIVINSLYIHREIFVRELISNASDALEKMRHESLVNKKIADKDSLPEIRIDTDKENHTFTITDTGVGMTHDELVSNLGTIARSGTKEFLEKFGEDKDLNTELIGKFGVGFYSSFMVSDGLRVRTRSYKPSAKGYEWYSEGVGEYSITEMNDLPRGTSIICKLKEDAYEFEDADTIKSIIKKYSNFVPFPILVDGEKINTVQAIWTKSRSEVTDTEYTEFFKFLSNSDDDPLFHLHLTADAPLQLSSIMYVPAHNFEQYGLSKLKPSVNIYCKKVLVQQNAEKLMPDYLRFVTGVVDSADLPLNISRETLQDNFVFRKLGKFLTKRFLKFIVEEAEKNADTYTKFWDVFNAFIKEGMVSDYENRTELAKLLRFKSSTAAADDYVSLGDYVKRMKDGQEIIYFINGRSREDIDNGPYMESFRKRDIEVLYLYEPIDDFVMASLGEYDGKKMVSADSASVELPPVEDDGETKDKEVPADEIANLTAWMKDTLGDRVTEVRQTKRIMDRPAIVVNPDEQMTTSMRRIMKASGKDFGEDSPKVLEINPSHSLIASILKLRAGETDKGFLQQCVEQIYDNALAESGLLDNPGAMAGRIYSIMERALKNEE